ncbi:unnamed protein product [Durusdinium trenchii]|uniref:Secreted protein n=1 Tax=Durusdinium trenchii TaxID=1381693 RepID=A0ABP0MDT9_9DINO
MKSCSQAACRASICVWRKRFLWSGDSFTTRFVVLIASGGVLATSVDCVCNGIDRNCFRFLCDVRRTHEDEQNMMRMNPTFGRSHPIVTAIVLQIVATQIVGFQVERALALEVRLQMLHQSHFSCL